MTASPPTDIERVIIAISMIPKPWPKWPGGYPGRLDLALVDAVMSIRFRYGRARADGTWTGARGAVLRYEKHTQEISAPERMTYLASQDPVALERILNRQKVHAGKTKAFAIIEAAKRFTELGITEPTHLDPTDADHRALYLGVSGLGPVTWEYFTMLLNHEGVKADTWITQFVGRAVGQRALAGVVAGALVKDAAEKLKVRQKDLDYAIWNFASRTKLKDMPPIPEDL